MAGTMSRVCRLAAVALCLACGLCGAAARPAGDKPNIIFMVVDDLGWNDVGFHDTQIQSPYFDQLAAEGVKLSSYYVYRFCSPSRSTFQTGRYPYHLGQQTRMNLNPTPGIACGINLNYTFMPGVLKQAGYSTFALGKWHLGFQSNAYTPTYRGFDHYLGYYSGAEEHFTHAKMGEGKWFYDLSNNTGTVVEPCRSAVGKNGTYSVYLYGNETVRLINKQDPDVPMYIYLAWNVVHAPCEAPDYYLQKNAHIQDPGRRAFAGMMSALDDSLRHVVAALKAKEMYENTIIMVTTDNGGNLGGSGNNLPLRGGKYTFWEGGVRGIGFVHSPLLPPAVVGRSWDGLMHAADWYSTIASLAGVSTDNTGPLPADGVAMWDAIAHNTSSPRKNVPIQIWEDKGVIRQGPYKLIVGYPGWGKAAWDGWFPLPTLGTGLDPRDGMEMPPFTGDVEDPKTLCAKDPCLFNVVTDPGEHTDIAAANPAIVAELMAVYKEYAQSEVSVNASGLCPTQYGDKNDPRCLAKAEQVGFWEPWL